VVDLQHPDDIMPGGRESVDESLENLADLIVGRSALADLETDLGRILVPVLTADSLVCVIATLGDLGGELADAGVMDDDELTMRFARRILKGPC
jgi:hypothetical protein